MTTNLAELKKEYVKNLKISKIELGNLDVRTKYTQEGMVNAAKQKLQTLRPQLMGAILTDSITAYVSAGVDISSQLAELLSDKENDNVTQLDFNDLEKTLMATVYPQKHIKGYAFNSSTVSRLNNALVDIRTVIGASFIPPITVHGTDYKVLKNAEEALAHLQGLLVNSYGNDLKSLYLAKQMNTFTEKAMTNNDKMVFFVTDVTGGTKGLDQITGKTVFLTGDDNIGAGAAGLQSAVTGKLRKAKKTLTKTEAE